MIAVRRGLSSEQVVERDSVEAYVEAAVKRLVVSKGSVFSARLTADPHAGRAQVRTLARCCKGTSPRVRRGRATSSVLRSRRRQGLESGQCMGFAPCEVGRALADAAHSLDVCQPATYSWPQIGCC